MSDQESERELEPDLDLSEEQAEDVRGGYGLNRLSFEAGDEDEVQT